MKVFSISPNQLSDRLDPKNYKPEYLHLLSRFEELSKKSNFKICNLGGKEGLVKFKTSAFYESIAQTYGKKGIPFIRASDVKVLRVRRSDLVYLPSENAAKNGRISSLKSHDIVITKGGVYLGNVALIPQFMKKCMISRDVVGAVSKGILNPQYIAAFLSSALGQTQIQSIKTQQNQPHLTLPHLRKIKIVYSTELSSQILAIISKAEQLEIQAYYKIQKAISKIKEGVAIRMKEDWGEDYFFSIEMKDIEERWAPAFYFPPYASVERTLRRKFKITNIGSGIAKIKRGIEPGSKNYIRYLDRSSDEVPFIRTSDIVDYTIDDFPDFCLNRDIFLKSGQDLQPNDIIFSNDGKIGYSAMLVEGDECVIQSHLRRIRVTNTFTPEFVFAFLNTEFALAQISRRIYIQSTIATIGNRLLEIAIPHLGEDIENTVTSLVREAMDHYSDRKKLMQKAREQFDNLLI